MSHSAPLRPEPSRAFVAAERSRGTLRRAPTALLCAAALAAMPGAPAGTLTLFSTGSSSIPFTMSGTVFDATTSRTGAMDSSGTIDRDDGSTTSGDDLYSITTSSTFRQNIAPPLANSAITGIWDKIIRDFAPKPPKPPVPPVPPPPQSPRQTVASLTDDDFQGNFTATAPGILTMSGTITATPTLYDFGFSCVLLQPLPDFGDSTTVALSAEGLLENVAPGRFNTSSGKGGSGGSGAPWLFSGSAAPTLNATETVSLTLTPTGGSPLELTLAVNLYWSLDYGALPYDSQKMTIGSVVTNTPTTWSSVGTTTIAPVPEIDPMDTDGAVGMLLTVLALLEARRIAIGWRPRR